LPDARTGLPAETFNAPSLLAPPMATPATLAALVAGHLALIGLALFVASKPPLRQGRALAWPTPEELKPLWGALALYAGVIAIHLVGVRLDPWFTQLVGQDYAHAVFNVEGDAVSAFQAVRNPVLDAVFLVAYMFGYPFMIYAAPLFYLAHRDLRALKLAALSFVVLYALTLPFYIALPISNPWAVATQPWYHGRAVAFNLGQLWPDIVSSYWQFTTPNNELPSLHAAISCMTALVAWKAGYKRWAMIAGTFAVLIPIASFYMGVHWILDAVVGEAFAVASVAAGWKLATRSDAPREAPVPAPTVAGEAEA
jgi:hypothetical protein